MSKYVLGGVTECTQPSHQTEAIAVSFVHPVLIRERGRQWYSEKYLMMSTLVNNALMAKNKIVKTLHKESYDNIFLTYTSYAAGSMLTDGHMDKHSTIILWYLCQGLAVIIIQYI